MNWCGSCRAAVTIASTSRDMPMPASPLTSTTWPSPPRARRQRISTVATSCARPRMGWRLSRSAAKRPSLELSAPTRQARTGAGMPFSTCSPRSMNQKRPSTRRRVAGETMMVSGSARLCRRAARLGVSPSTARSSAAPSPTMSPTTTKPVAMPMRTRSSTSGRSFSLPTASTMPSPARIARSPSSSCACG